MENRICQINCPYLSNEFLFTFFSGVFTGLIVSIVAEILKFYGLKRDKELLLFNNLAYLYGQLNIAISQINHSFSHINNQVNGT